MRGDKKTIEHLNKVINDKYGNITDNTIKYFKNRFIDLNNKFNKISFFTLIL